MIPLLLKSVLKGEKRADSGESEKRQVPAWAQFESWEWCGAEGEGGREGQKDRGRRGKRWGRGEAGGGREKEREKQGEEKEKKSGT